MDDANRVTMAEYGRMRGLSRQRIHQLKKDGRIKVGEDGKLDPGAADETLASMLDRSRANAGRQIAAELELPMPIARSADAEQQPQRSSGAADYWVAKARREAVEEQLAQLRLQEKLGALCQADEVRRAAFETYQRAATTLLQIPARIAPVIAPQDPLRAERLMTEELQKVIDGLAREFGNESPGGTQALAA